MIPYAPEAYRLLHEGAIALAAVEANGIRVDIPHVEKAISQTRRRIRRIQDSLEDTDVVKEWRKRFRSKTNLNSHKQLGLVLFETMELDPPGLTATERFKTDETSLATINHPFVRRFLLIQKLQKATGTYLEPLLRMSVDGFIHPFFNLHLVRTFRSSSDSPNFQNIPVRDPRIGRLVRLSFIARDGWVLVEIDYSGIEVCIAACYHLDPAMIAYLEDPSTDMHRDMAMECYLLDEEEVTKVVRYCAKNKFVFPEFYGDWYITCARNLWDAIDSMHLTTASGIPLKQHLKSKGIRKLGELNPKERPRAGTFERHIQQVEKRFWNRRFPIYAKWKKDWFAEYQRKGWFKTKTGFICQGSMKKNKVINYPPQGSAFHCLLWSLIRLQRALEKKKMKTKLVGQIHDSILADVPYEELDEYLALARKVMVTRLKKRWPWIVVPLKIEAEVSPIGGSWADKEEIKING